MSYSPVVPLFRFVRIFLVIVSLESYEVKKSCGIGARAVKKQVDAEQDGKRLPHRDICRNWFQLLLIGKLFLPSYRIDVDSLTGALSRFKSINLLFFGGCSVYFRVCTWVDPRMCRNQPGASTVTRFDFLLYDA